MEKKLLLLIVVLQVSFFTRAQYVQEWQSRFSDTSSVEILDTDVDEHGNIVIASGYKTDDSTLYCDLRKVNKHGLLQWKIPISMMYATTSRYKNVQYANGSIYCLTNSGFFRFNNAGTLTWADSTICKGRILVDSSQNILVITGDPNSQLPLPRLVKIDPSNTIIYDTTFADPIYFWFTLFDTTGNLYGSGSYDSIEHIFKISPEGNFLWHNTYASPAKDVASYLQLLKDGNVLAVASRNTVAGGNIYRILTPQGNILKYSPTVSVGSYPGIFTLGDSILWLFGNDGQSLTLSLRDTAIYTHRTIYINNFAFLTFKKYEDWFLLLGVTPCESYPCDTGFQIFRIDNHLNILSQYFTTDKNTHCLLNFDAEGDIWLSTNTYAAFHVADTIVVDKLCVSCRPNITGISFIDTVTTCILDSAEGRNAGRLIHLLPDNIFAVSNTYGEYSTLRPNGSYILTEQLPPYWLHTCADSVLISIDSINSNSYDNNFGSMAMPGVHDKVVSIVTWDANPGFEEPVFIRYGNVGTEVESGFVMWQKPDSIVLANSTPTHDSVSGNFFFWNYQNLNLNEYRQIHLQVGIPAGLSLNAELKHVASIYPILGDTTPQNNIDSISVSTTGSFDPNDKISEPTNTTPLGFLTDSSWIRYTIRFQNTGTDTALNVVIIDTLSDKFDIGSFRAIESSHAYQLSIDAFGEMYWRFSNILLPDSSANFMGSCGFISYELKVKEGLLPGTQIDNSASIYFDFNEAIQTNTVTNWIEAFPNNLPSQNHGFNSKGFTVFPNPTNNACTVKLNNSYDSGAQLVIFNLLGQKVFLSDFDNRVEIMLDEHFLSGLYIISVRFSDGYVTQRKLVISSATP